MGRGGGMGRMEKEEVRESEGRRVDGKGKVKGRDEGREGKKVKGEEMTKREGKGEE